MSTTWPLACTRSLSGRIRHAEPVVGDDFSHFLPMQEPDPFTDTMIDWLARHTPRA